MTHFDDGLLIDVALAAFTELDFQLPDMDHATKQRLGRDIAQRLKRDLPHLGRVDPRA